MIKSYKIHFENRHLIIKDGENTILVDTGNPMTIHVADSLEFAGTSYPASTNAMGNTIASLQTMSGVSFTTLIGLDILATTTSSLTMRMRRWCLCRSTSLHPRVHTCPCR